MNDVRRDWLDRRVHELIRVEAEIEAALSSAPDSGIALDDASESELAGLPAQHRDALIGYLGTTHSDASVDSSDSGHGARSRSDDDGSASALPSLFAILSCAVIGYAALFEAALRLYDPELREIAPRHASDYSAAMHTVAQLLAPAVAAELASRGLECQCVCPMCSLGVCGCVALGGMAATAPLRPRASEPGSEAGFAIQSPRRGSQLAGQRVAAGDRLLAIDGQPVSDVSEIQAAIRKHEIGETLRLLIAHDGEHRELEATHVGDYPSQ